MPILKQVLPRAFCNGGYEEAPAYRYRDVRVTAVKRSGAPCSNHSELYAPWPGPGDNVRAWYVLENGKAVGVDESPDGGCAFPVVDYPP